MAGEVERAADDADVVPGGQDVVDPELQDTFGDIGRARVGVDAAEGQRGRAILPERAVADDPVDGDVGVDVEITVAAAQVHRAVEGQGARVGGVAQAEVGRAADDQVVVDRPGGRGVAGKDRGEGVIAVRVDRQ